MKANIIYYSATGNTELMANSILANLEEFGHEVASYYVSDISVSDIIDCDLLILGSPAMSNEDVEDYEFRPFFDELKENLEGREVILFGSYDWGEGEWMENWSAETNETGAKIVATFIAQLEPAPEVYEEIETRLTELYKWKIYI